MSKFIVGLLLSVCTIASSSGARAFASEASEVDTETFAAKTGLRIEVAQNRSFVLPGVGQSCAMTRILPGRISYPQVRISWDGDKPLTDVGLILVFQHPSIEGGRFVCEINRGEFDAAFGVMGAVVGAGASVKNLGNCPVQCGGLKFVSKAGAFRATGTLTAVGLTSQGAAQLPFQASAPVEFDFVP